MVGSQINLFNKSRGIQMEIRKKKTLTNYMKALLIIIIATYSKLLKFPLYQIAFNIEIYFIETTINNEESILTFQVIFCS